MAIVYTSNQPVCIPCQFGNCGGCNGYCSCPACGGDGHGDD